MALFYGAISILSVILSLLPVIVDGGLKFIAIFALSATVALLVLANFHRRAHLETKLGRLTVCGGDVVIDRADIEKIVSRQKAGDNQFQFVLHTRGRHFRWLPGIVLALGQVVMFRVEGEGAENFAEEFERWVGQPRSGASG